MGRVTLEGQEWILSTFELSGQGLGASAVRDGLDWGYAMWNPESDHGDVETWELNQGGVPYLSRKVKQNTAGHGKYRGGASFETVAMIWGSEGAEYFFGKDGLCHWSSGMSGGYPDSTAYSLITKNTNMEEIIENRDEYPIGDDDPGSGDFEDKIEGDVLRKPNATIYPQQVENYDLVHWMMLGGEGYGDPLERKLESVKEDLKDGIYTKDVVNNVYGVIAKHDKENNEWNIDREKTEERRQEIREERGEKSVPFDEFWNEERNKVMDKDLAKPVLRMFAESLGLSDEWAEEFLEFWDLPEDFEIEVE